MYCILSTHFVYCVCCTPHNILCTLHKYIHHILQCKLRILLYTSSIGYNVIYTLYTVHYLYYFILHILQCSIYFMYCKFCFTNLYHLTNTDYRFTACTGIVCKLHGTYTYSISKKYAFCYS